MSKKALDFSLAFLIVECFFTMRKRGAGNFSFIEENWLCLHGCTYGLNIYKRVNPGVMRSLKDVPAPLFHLL